MNNEKKLIKRKTFSIFKSEIFSFPEYTLKNKLHTSKTLPLITYHYLLCLFFINRLFYSGSVSIKLIVAETENWKHCNKIIFKCVNSIVGPMNSVWIVFFVSYTVILLFTAEHKTKKKKKEKKKAWKRRAETQLSALPKRSLYLFFINQQLTNCWSTIDLLVAFLFE